MRADEVIANGVVIHSGAKFSLRPIGADTLTVGQVFTVISNTSAKPDLRHLSQLRDGQVITVNSSNRPASYTVGEAMI